MNMWDWEKEYIKKGIKKYTLWGAEKNPFRDGYVLQVHYRDGAKGGVKITYFYTSGEGCDLETAIKQIQYELKRYLNKV